MSTLVSSVFLLLLLLQHASTPYTRSSTRTNATPHGWSLLHSSATATTCHCPHPSARTTSSTNTDRNRVSRRCTHDPPCRLLPGLER